MKIKKRELLHLFEKFPSLEISLAVNNISENENVELVNGKVFMQSTLDEEYLSKVDDNDEVNITVNTIVYNRIKEVFPKKFPEIEYSLTVEQCMEMLQDVNFINRYSAKKRSMIYARDIAERQSASGLSILEVNCRQEVDEQSLSRVNKLFRAEKTPGMIAVSLLEKGILAYIEKKSENYSTGKQIENAVKLSELPFIVCEDRVEMIEKFKRLNPKLVVLAYLEESLNAMTLYLYMKRLDPFVKILEINEVYMDTKGKQLSSTIAEMYKEDYHKTVEHKRQKKKKMTISEEEAWKKQVEDLQLNYSKRKHVTLSYKLHKHGEEYDTIIVQNLLRKVLQSLEK